MKFYNLAIIITGVLLLLNIAGYSTVIAGGVLSGTDMVTSGNISIENFKSSKFYDNPGDISNPGLKQVLLLFIGSGIVLGAFGRAPDIRYGTAALVFIWVAALSTDIIHLFSYVGQFNIQWMTWLLGSILVSTIIALYVSAISYWQGSDG